MIIKMFKSRLDELGVFVALELAFFIFGIIIVAIPSVFEHSKPDFDVFRMGTMMALMMGTLGYVLIGMTFMRNGFDMVVGYGRSRRNFFLTDFVVSFMHAVVLMSIVFGIYYLEGIWNRMVYQGVPEETLFSFVPAYWMVLALSLVLVVIRMFMGSLFMRFGRVVFWSLWSLWMVVMLFGQRISEMNNEFINALKKAVLGMAAIQFAQWIFIILAVLIIFSIISWLVVRKHQVTI